MPILRRCVDCRTLTEGVRCSPHATAYETAKTQRKREVRPRIAAEDARRAQAVRDWVAVDGWNCPGWHRLPHPVAIGDLTADHITPVAAGGPEDGPLTVRCTSCNSARGKRTD